MKRFIDRLLGIQSFSQYGQDRFVYKSFFRGKKNGFFVEIGADDGIDKSNSFMFEKIGWEGICIEPSPRRFESLKKNRKCICINALIASESKEYSFNDYSGWGKGLSGALDLYDSRHLERIQHEVKHPDHKGKNTYLIKSVQLSKIFQENNIKDIDFCSIDVEGAELEVIKSIDFENVRIKVFVIENNYGTHEVENHLKKYGYRLSKKLFIDDVYIHDGYLKLSK